MKTERIIEIKDKATSVIKELLKTKSFEELTVCGSFMRFDLSCGLYTADKQGNKFVTYEEFNSDEYEIALKEVFNSVCPPEYRLEPQKKSEIIVKCFSKKPE